MTESQSIESLEIDLIVKGIWERYHYDFRDYSKASLHRRFKQILTRTGCKSISYLQDKILREPEFFTQFLSMLTVTVTEMFRDPDFFKQIRNEVIPVLKTYPSLKIWVAGCSTGEEVYSYAILLYEAGLLHKSLIYGTDINPLSLTKAKSAVFDAASIRKYTENYQKSGGTAAFSDYYQADYGAAVLDPKIRKNILFTDHSLATDQVFSEVNLISCRNVLIYFDQSLQERALGLFKDSLCRKGFLALGSKESLRFCSQSNSFADFVRDEKVYQKRDRPHS